MKRAHDRLAILRGTLDILVLKALAGRPLHGFEISLWLDDHSDGSLHLEDSALYQCLHRLEDRGYILGEWGISENNRRARYYRLTRAGQRRLKLETEGWNRRVAAIARLLET